MAIEEGPLAQQERFNGKLQIAINATIESCEGAGLSRPETATVIATGLLTHLTRMAMDNMDADEFAKSCRESYLGIQELQRRRGGGK